MTGLHAYLRLLRCPLRQIRLNKRKSLPARKIQNKKVKGGMFVLVNTFCMLPIIPLIMSLLVVAAVTLYIMNNKYDPEQDLCKANQSNTQYFSRPLTGKVLPRIRSPQRSGLFFLPLHPSLPGNHTTSG
jgi:hypothetical protein